MIKKAVTGLFLMTFCGFQTSAQANYDQSGQKQYCLETAWQLQANVQIFEDTQGFKEKCLPLAKALSKKNGNMSASLPNQSLSVFSLENFLYIQENEEERFLAGTKTLINEIESLSLSQDSKSVALLNRKKDNSQNILIFNTSKSGNIAPFRIIEIEDQNFSIDKILFVSNQEILLLNEDLGTALRVDTSKDSRSPRMEDKPQFQFAGKIQKEDQKIKTVSFLNQRILALTEHSVLIYSSTTLELIGETKLTNEESESIEQKIITNQSEDSFSLMAKNGEMITFDFNNKDGE